MAETYDLTKVERMERVVPASPEEVEAFLSEHTSLIPGRGTFTGTVRDGRFSLLRKTMGKRNLRPRLEGTLEAVDGGTRVAASCALPSWGRFLGRGLFLWSILFGMLWLAMGYGLGGMPESTWVAMGAVFMALVWMPVTGVVISGSIVKEAVEERERTPEALATVLDAKWPISSSSASEPEEERRQAARRAQATRQPAG